MSEDITGMAAMHPGVSPQQELDYFPQLIAITTTPISLDLADLYRLATIEAWDMNF